MFHFPASIGKSRRRRQIRTKLDDVSRVMGLHFRGGVADCALVSAQGEVLTAKGVSPRPFVALAPRVTALRASSAALAAALTIAPPRTLHVRGAAWLVAVYALGPHALLAYASAPLDAHDGLLRAMDRALLAGGGGGGAGGSSSSVAGVGPVAELAQLVKEMW
jgi:hypothetical protein